MALAGFKITNHPQQVKARGANDFVDERITPQDLFDGFNNRFRFTLDAAANERNRKVERFYSLDHDGLTHPWVPGRVWCNPPYSNLAAWLHKAHEEFKVGCEAIVMLLPANRTEQKWWQQFVEPFRDGKGPIKCEFIARRRNFGVPGNEGGVYNSSPPFGLVALIFEQEAA